MLNYRRYFYGEHNKNVANWSLDEGYQSKEKAFPLRSLNIQKKVGISIDIRQIRELNHDCWWKDLYVSLITFTFDIDFNRTSLTDLRASPIRSPARD